MNKIFIWLVVVVVIVAGGFFLFRTGNDGNRDDAMTAKEGEGIENEPNIPATGNTDDVLAAILNSVAGDDMTPDVTDPSLFDSGSAELDGFDRSFDASGL
ncbi:MAG: hypothetical protein G01um101420_933 [Parcubacteria group bacterium Gr01-1014_20]|nr:MAG: hypothetical protein G01um101420_933 [Parcubacteria group bacterium Gr01-1014_20]